MDTALENNGEEKEEKRKEEGNYNIPKKKKKSKPQQKPEKKTDVQLLDEILKETKIEETTCYTTGCPKTVLISRTCEFCKHKYCLYHGLPEAHGCGAEAKKKARADWLKQNSADPKKPLKKVDLHNKLQKKISEASDSRSRKLKEKEKK